MLGWILRQTLFLLLLCVSMILGIIHLAQYKHCLCVSLHIEQEDKTAFQFIDIETGSTYSITPHQFLGQDVIDENGQNITYTFQDKTISLRPEDAMILADRTPSLSADSPWLAYLPPLDNPSHSDLIYFVVYSYTVGDARIYEVHLLDFNAGQLRRLFSPRNAIASLSWSRDYQQVFVLTSNRDILEYDILSGSIQARSNIHDTLANYGNVKNARISTNAERVLFTLGKNRLVILNLNNDSHITFDLDVEHVINAIWWEQP